MARAKAKVQEYTRQLASGTKVTVHGHDRTYQAADARVAAKRTPVMAHERELAKKRAQEKRKQAWKGLRRRGKQSWRLARRGGKRMRRATRYARRHKKAMAAACAVGGLVEVGAGLLWSTTGVVIATVAMIASVLTGGFLIGGESMVRDQPKKAAATGGTANQGQPGAASSTSSG